MGCGLCLMLKNQPQRVHRTLSHPMIGILIVAGFGLFGVAQCVHINSSSIRGFLIVVVFHHLVDTREKNVDVLLIGVVENGFKVQFLVVSVGVLLDQIPVVILGRPVEIVPLFAGEMRERLADTIYNGDAGLVLVGVALEKSCRGRLYTKTIRSE